MWICHELSDLIRKLRHKDTNIIHGDAHDVENIMGISCIDTVDTTQDSINITNEKGEYLSLLQMLSLAIQRLILQRILITATNAQFSHTTTNTTAGRSIKNANSYTTKRI
ncbi:hypothetical protein QE152_g36892 [Popillia japonica]|uniref:Uncharacterized protein n=1 Tax=Popillia japonica TaxID=7064 RepID=A0AAW1ICD4_POPJA